MHENWMRFIPILKHIYILLPPNRPHICRKANICNGTCININKSWISSLFVLRCGAVAVIILIRSISPVYLNIRIGMDGINQNKSIQFSSFFKSCWSCFIFFFCLPSLANRTVPFLCTYIIEGYLSSGKYWFYAIR